MSRSFYVNVDSSKGFRINAEVEADYGHEAIQVVMDYQDKPTNNPKILSWHQEVTRGIGGS